MEVGTDLAPIAPRTLASAGVAPRSAEDIAVAFLLGYGPRTRAAYRDDLRAFFSWCGTVGLDPLRATRAHIDGYVRGCGEIDQLAPATIARRMSAISGFYVYAESEDLVARNPVTHVRRPKVGTETTSTGLSVDELRSLVAEAEADGPRTHCLVLLLGLNGLRISEALLARVEDLSSERGHKVLVVTRKGGRRATIPLAPRTAEAIDALVANRSTGPIFATRTGKALDRPAAWRTLRRLARDGVPSKAGSIHPHDLRHAFVTLALDAGASLRDVQDAAGHADPRTTRRYDRARHNLDRHPTYALAGLV
ncbi:MAG: tyrosine-type recombinase/integrase [Acidimicrobiales bacterium]